MWSLAVITIKFIPIHTKDLRGDLKIPLLLLSDFSQKNQISFLDSKDSFTSAVIATVQNPYANVL